MPLPILEAELQVAGVRASCTATWHGLAQATDYVGRPSSGVRFQSQEVLLTGEVVFLAIWDELALDSFRRESGHLTWRTTQGQTMRRLTFYDAYCTRLSLCFDTRGQDGKPSVELRLRFSPAAIDLDGAYLEQYVRLWWEPDWRTRQRAFLQPGPVLPPLPPLPSVALAALKLAAEAVGKAAGAVLGTAALVLAPTNNTDAPGYDAEKNFSKNHPTPLPNPDAFRLAELERARALAVLTPEEEAEYVALLAKVKGIHVQSLEDLDVEVPLRGNNVPLPGFYYIQLSYTKRSDADREALRRKFDSNGRKNFLKHLGNDPTKHAPLKKSGLTDAQIDDLTKGIRPSGYQVHHKLPLDDGGDNSFNNLLLIKNEPYHKVITNVQNAATPGMAAGNTRIVQWPMCDGFVYP
jgi:hypothetical protein